MKIIKVESCVRCPYRKVLDEYPPEYHSHNCYEGGIFKGRIHDINTIPSWCPLEDYQESLHEGIMKQMEEMTKASKHPRIYHTGPGETIYMDEE